MKVLFVGCHCDDIELGCGGTVHKYVQAGVDVLCYTFSRVSVFQGQDIDLSEASSEAMKVLGVDKPKYYDFPTNRFHEVRQKVWQGLNWLEKMYNPDVVFTNEWDNQQDHETLFKEVTRNFRRATIISYKASVRNAPEHSYNMYEELSLENLTAKKSACQCYYPLYKELIYFKMENIEAVVRNAGIYVESEFAEPFSVVKMLCK
jgi:LmbE family N-acetylglucosaminyl deacetylase